MMASQCFAWSGGFSVCELRGSTAPMGWPGPWRRWAASGAVTSAASASVVTATRANRTEARRFMGLLVRAVGLVPKPASTSGRVRQDQGSTCKIRVCWNLYRTPVIGFTAGTAICHDVGVTAQLPRKLSSNGKRKETDRVPRIGLPQAPPRPRVRGAVVAAAGCKKEEAKPAANPVTPSSRTSASESTPT